MTHHLNQPGPMAGRGKVPVGVRRPRLAFDPIVAALRQLHGRALTDELPEEFTRLLDRLGDPAPKRRPA